MLPFALVILKIAVDAFKQNTIGCKTYGYFLDFTECLAKREQPEKVWNPYKDGILQFYVLYFCVHGDIQFLWRLNIPASDL